MTINTTRVEIRIGELGLTKKALAEQCGIRPQNLSTILRRGTAIPANVVRIAKALDVQVEDIIIERS